MQNLSTVINSNPFNYPDLREEVGNLQLYWNILECWPSAFLWPFLPFPFDFAANCGRFKVQTYIKNTNIKFNTR